MLQDLPDIDLWLAFKDGNKEAFGGLFRRHYSLLYQYGMKLCTDTEVVEDCIQELFIELWQTSANPQVQSVKAYLLTALKYKIFKVNRSAAPAASFDESGEYYGFEINPENFMITRQEDMIRSERILSAMQQLPARQKEIIYLKIYQDLSYDEISEVMGINYQVARNLFSQAIKSMRKILSPL